ncbi:MAG: CBS domain-containing protein [Methanoregula sp.]|jgi:CBS domain-containing protein|nr:CBS domain-containing protein [Methanoregula sp.]
MPDAPETSLRVDDFMTREIVRVREDKTVASVAGIMGAKRVGSAIIIHDGKPAGIFTECDPLSTFLVQGKSLETMVGMASTSPLKTAPTGTSIHEAAKIRAAQHVRRLPLIKKKQLAGIITHVIF